MKLGDTGINVTELQIALNEHGYNLVVDADYGKATEKAVRDFQSKNGLEIDGQAGKITLAKLRGEKIETPKLVITQGLDSRTEKYFKTLDPKAQVIFLPFILEAKKIVADMGYDYFIVSGNRTPEEQAKLYAQGRTTSGPIVTNAKPYQSNHQYGIAVDFGVFKDGSYLDENHPGVAEKVHLLVAKIASKYGLEAGAYWNFKDEPHFEVKTGLTLAQKKDKLIKFGSVL